MPSAAVFGLLARFEKENFQKGEFNRAKCVQVKGVMPKSGITPLGHRPAKPGEIIVSKKNANINQMDFHYKYHI